MKKTAHIIFFTFLNLAAQTQDTLNIRECFQKAVINHPLYRQIELNSKMSSYTVSNISKLWFPDISLNGQATYQSDVVGFGTFTAPHDQYKLYFEVNQQLYDGGVAKSRKEIERANLDISQQQLEIEFHNIKKQVISVYFSIVNFKKQSELLSITHAEVSDRMRTIQVAIRNGALLPENEFILRAEILKIELQQDEFYHKIGAAVEVLNQLTGLEISTNHVFSVPYNAEIGDRVAERPEMAVFDFQKALIENNISFNKGINRPKIFAFAQTGYGKPGLNMLGDEFDSYYAAGIGLKWNLFDWGETRNKVKSGNIQIESVDVNRKNFERNISVGMQYELANIEYYKSAMQKDEKLVDLRASIKENAYSRLQNGTITATDYLAEANAELFARLQLETHKIFLIQSIINYQLIKGDI